ncbi:hypothetical protein HK102_002784 [Quaeritorhiza haematococci]|nr:hypothetical protein HK102_002784 [Quaeritorhiza haematococci]
MPSTKHPPKFSPSLEFPLPQHLTLLDFWRSVKPVHLITENDTIPPVLEGLDIAELVKTRSRLRPMVEETDRWKVELARMEAQEESLRDMLARKTMIDKATQMVELYDNSEVAANMLAGEGEAMKESGRTDGGGVWWVLGSEDFPEDAELGIEAAERHANNLSESDLPRAIYSVESFATSNCSEALEQNAMQGDITRILRGMRTLSAQRFALNTRGLWRLESTRRRTATGSEDFGAEKSETGSSWRALMMNYLTAQKNWMSKHTRDDSEDDLKDVEDVLNSESDAEGSLTGFASAGITKAFASSYGVYEKIDFFVAAIMHCSFALAITGFGLMFSGLVSRPLFSNLVIGLVAAGILVTNFVVFMPGASVVPELSSSWITAYGSIASEAAVFLLAPLALVRAAVKAYQSLPTTGETVLVLAFSPIVFLFLAWYFNPAVPSADGFSRVWYFPFTSSFWTGKQKRKEVIAAGDTAAMEQERSKQTGSVRILKLSKQYKNTTAVKEFTHTMEAGKVYCVLGPNGAAYQHVQFYLRFRGDYQLLVTVPKAETSIGRCCVIDPDEEIPSRVHSNACDIRSRITGEGNYCGL